MRFAGSVVAFVLVAFPATATALNTAPDPTVTVLNNIPAQQTGTTYTGLYRHDFRHAHIRQTRVGTSTRPSPTGRAGSEPDGLRVDVFRPPGL
jgi:hypothetical protein